MGGDEFVAVMPDMEEAAFDALVEEAKRVYGEDALCKAAVGSAYWSEGEDFEAKVGCADHAMYENKASYYRNSGKDRRRRR